MARGEPISQEQFEKNWPQVKWQLEVEGMNPILEDNEVMRKVATGEESRSTLNKGIL